MNYKKLSKVGQIKKGAIVVATYKSSVQKHTVDEVLHAGTDKEEILLDTKSNLYFNTSMAIDGISWAKEVNFANHCIDQLAEAE